MSQQPEETRATRLYRSLNRSLDLHEELLDGMPVGVIGLSEEGRVILYNTAQERLTGYPRSEAIGKPFFGGIARSFDCEEIREPFERALPPNLQSSMMEWCIDADGTGAPRFVVLRFLPLSFRERHIVAIIAEDISEQRRLGLERDRLLSALFHDLRAPLSGIHCYAGLFDPHENAECPSSSEALGALKQIGAVCQDLLDLIDATTNQLSGDENEAELLDLAFLAHGIAVESTMVCGQGKLQLLMNGRTVSAAGSDECPVPVRVFASRSDASRCIRNLLGNACKYAESRIELTVAQDDRQRVSVTIEDDGPGIPDGYEQRIFSGGVQAPGAKPGHGLGLETVKIWVDAMLGSISADRSPLGGARFRMCLPTS